jgi:hypothetical protein
LLLQAGDAEPDKQPLGGSGSGDGGSSSPAFSSGSFAPRAGGASYSSALTPDELRRLEQQGMLETEIDELRRAQNEMQREKPGVPLLGGKHSWLKN